MWGDDAVLKETDFRYIVWQYLLGQDWQLVDADELAGRIWQHYQGHKLSGQDGAKMVQNAVRMSYAATLHNACRAPQTDVYDRAWQELRAWLSRQAHVLIFRHWEREDIIQETSIRLNARLQRGPLREPHALFAYAVQTIRRTHIDQRRRAEARGETNTLSIEMLGPAGETVNWQDKLSAAEAGKRETENLATERTTEQQLVTFFQRHLPTQLQQAVMIAHIINNMKPSEIARLLGKRPHEIRLVKARAIQKLRTLPPESNQTLLQILKGLR